MSETPNCIHCGGEMFTPEEDHDALECAWCDGQPAVPSAADATTPPPTNHSTRSTTMEIGNFHNRDGWYFKRLSDGSVRIQKTETSQAEAPVALEHIIAPNEWASIVAHVSAASESAETYDMASQFHAGRSRYSQLLRDVREFAQIAAAVYPDDSLSVRATMGAIPARSFAALFEHAKRKDSPASAFDVAD